MIVNPLQMTMKINYNNEDSVFRIVLMNSDKFFFPLTLQ